VSTRIYVDGRITDEASAVVPVLDRGFLYGDSVYEVTRTAGGRPVDLEPHLDRLARSAAGLAMALPPRETIVAAIDATLAAAENADSYIRVVVTRGSGEFGLDPALATESRLVIVVRPLARPAASLYEHGAAARRVDVERTSRRALDPSIKSGNYLNNILALAEAKRHGANEAILCDARGRVAEGATSNVWSVKDGVALTPPDEVGLLPGITRWRLFELARGAGIEARQAVLTADDLRAADELFITSSIRHVLPITRLDDRSLPIGPVTRRLAALYDEFVSDVARSASPRS
jgi:branched-chain amino acid aminotransferase